MSYDFAAIEKKWQEYWAKNKTFKCDINPDKPKYYVLDMFPYPSGAGLHVGHPLGYIASDIYARYKRLKGFEVLHPMGYDSFGLPAEQYAIQTGQHPAVTTEKNIARYREQLDQLGFSFDWDREVRTSDPEYYRWTQWIFIKLFNSWYSYDLCKALPIQSLIEIFELTGSSSVDAACTEELEFTAAEWMAMSEEEQQKILLNYRLAYLSESIVNWCPELGTVLANDEVKDGVSERGGYPVEQRKMLQWSMRITAYADRLLNDLDLIDWPDSIKEMQRNWIGRSEGALINFPVDGSEHTIEVFTTRPDTIFGVSFMVLAPEHPLVNEITAAAHKDEVQAYIEAASKRTDRERLAESKKVTGAFTGAYVKHPFTGEDIPVWVSDYVLYHYGTGAIMAVPSGDQRDWNFANHFGLPIPNIIEGADISKGAYEGKDEVLKNSGFLNGMRAEEAIEVILDHIEEHGLGRRKVNFKLRDAVFSRQRYWGEPIPVYFKNGIPYAMKAQNLPLELPEVDKYLPTRDGQPPLARAVNWKTKEGYPIETNTMPGWAGSSWYYIRYEDPKNNNRPASKEAINYWQNVDLYMGGAEHATGHLLYVRFWTKFLHDIGLLPFDEPAKKLVNQGMIQGVSKLVYRHKATGYFVSFGIVAKLQSGEMSLKAFNRLVREQLGDHALQIKDIGFSKLHADISMVDGEVLDTEAFRNWRSDFKDAVMITENNRFLCEPVVEKMSKSKYNVVNPDDIIAKYGADALRLHEMFLGPIEMHKPWNTKGIDGVARFLRKFWALFVDADGNFIVTDEEPGKGELKILHQTIKKIEDDMERLSFNTIVSHLMVCVNSLSSSGCHKRSILEPLVILASSHAPHISEELWQRLGHEESVSKAAFPEYKDDYLKEDTKEYPVSFNGKVRFKIALPLDLSQEEVEKAVVEHEAARKWLGDKPPKKVIYVKGRIINVVV